MYFASLEPKSVPIQKKTEKKAFRVGLVNTKKTTIVRSCLQTAWCDSYLFIHDEGSTSKSWSKDEGSKGGSQVTMIQCKCGGGRRLKQTRGLHLGVYKTSAPPWLLKRRDVSKSANSLICFFYRLIRIINNCVQSELVLLSQHPSVSNWTVQHTLPHIRKPSCLHVSRSLV